MEVDNSCLNCQYYPSDNNTQECMRYQRGEICDDPENDECFLIACPEHCVYPYDSEYFDESVREEYTSSVNNLNEDPENTSAQSEYLSYLNLGSLSTEIYDNGEYKIVTDDNINQLPRFKCANLIKNREVPHLPDTSSNNVRNKLIEAFNTRNNLHEQIDHLPQTQWSKLKVTSNLTDHQIDHVSDNITEIYLLKDVSYDIDTAKDEIRDGNLDNVIQTSNNGVDINWWSSTLSDSELMDFVNNQTGIDNYVPDSHSIEDIREQIHINRGGVTNSTLEGSDILSNLDIVIDSDNICEQEVIDWINKELHITSSPGKSASGVSPIYSFADIFNISGDTNLGAGFEQCMNEKFDTEDDDSKMIEQISSYNRDMSKLTKTDIRYIKEKIIKFLQLKPEDIDDCLDKIEDLSLTLCNGQLSKNSMEVLGKVLHMDTPNINTDTPEGEQKLENLKLVQKELLPFVPQILRQIINISKNMKKIIVLIKKYRLEQIF